MAQTMYTYSIATDTLNAAYDGKLTDEILDSAIVIALDYINTTDDVLDIYFKDALSVGDEAILTGLVNAHDGVMLLSQAPQQVEITQVDQDTLGLPVTNKFAPDGFYQRLHEIEFTTATLGGALHDKDIDNVDTGWSSIKFYRLVSSVETEFTPVDQADLDANCIRSDYSFMPNVDYMVKSGVISHQQVPAQEVYMWGKMLDVDPVLNGSGIFPVEVLGGGMAMSFVDARDPVGLKGVNGTLLYYGGVMGPNGYIPTGGGLGTNRITFVMRHDAGFKHRFQAIFEIFRA